MTNLNDKIATYSPEGEGPRFISAYSKKQRQRITFPAGTGRTKQSHKAECDINQILARFKRTGILEFTNRHEPQYGDVTSLDYQEAQLLVARANSMFAELPSQVRDRFENDPAQFLDFVQDEENRAEAEELGLLKPVEERIGGGSTPPSSPPTPDAARAARSGIAATGTEPAAPAEPKK